MVLWYRTSSEGGGGGPDYGLTPRLGPAACLSSLSSIEKPGQSERTVNPSLLSQSCQRVKHLSVALCLGSGKGLAREATVANVGVLMPSH